MGNEHDKRYKRLFENPDIVEELLTSFVDEEFVEKLDFSTLETETDKSFISPEFQKRESDTICRIKFKEEYIYIYILLEFQSSVDYSMPVRMLRYICEFYQWLKPEPVKNEKYPAVFPILLYNGDRKWTAKTNIKEVIDNVIPERFIPDFSYYKIAENEFDKERLYSIKNALSAIFLIENSGDVERIREETGKLASLIDKEKPEIKKLLSRWFINLLGIDNKQTVNKIIDIRSPEKMISKALEDYKKKIKEEEKEEAAKNMKADGEPL